MGIERPILIVGAPRSGTTLLFSILSSHPDLWSLYRESAIIEAYLPPEAFGWSQGNALGAEDAASGITEQLRDEFYKGALNYQIVFPNTCSTVYTNRLWEQLNRKVYRVLDPLVKPRDIRVVEKTPKNCLRIPFLDAIFPDSFFVFLTRDPRTNIGSLMEGWKEPGRYETYDLPGGVEIEGYGGKAWNFLLPPGWERYVKGVRLEEVCAFQYGTANQRALEDLEEIPPRRKVTVRYEDLVAHSEVIVKAICDQAALDYRGGLRILAEQMPAVNTASRPKRDKWKKNEREVLSVIGTVREIAETLGYTL